MFAAKVNAIGILATALMSASLVSAKYINYTTITGFFLQDDPSTNPSGFDYTQHMWGLINRTYPTDNNHQYGGGYGNGYGNGNGNEGDLTQWQRFTRYVKDLNRKAPRNVDYKVIFMGRHGEGYHNAAESFFGTPAWNCYYALLNGNSTATWADAKLTPNGVKQALIANNFWNHSINVQKIQTPESYYASPLWRCLDTAQITFKNLGLKGDSKFKPLIKELLREGITAQTCNRRRSKKTIRQNFEGFKFEDGFTQYDEIWSGVNGETGAGQAIRSKKLLDDVFGSDDNTWLSFSSHSGEIASLLGVLKHRSFPLGTGQVIPVLVKAETLRDAPTPTATTSSTPASTPYLHCTQSPVTSISGTGCVCPNGASPTATQLVPNDQLLN